MAPLGTRLRPASLSALTVLFVACGSSTREGGASDGSAGSVGTAASAGSAGAAGNGVGGTGLGGSGNPGTAGVYGPECFSSSVCCDGSSVVITEGHDCHKTLLPCEQGCDPQTPCITDVARAPSLCRGVILCDHTFDCVQHEDAAAGEMLACNSLQGICYEPLPSTERPYGYGSSCMLADLTPYFTDPDALERVVVRAHGCVTGICVLDEADALGVPQRCTYRCVPSVTDCGPGYECRELEVRGEIDDPPSVAVCVSTVAG